MPPIIGITIGTSANKYGQDVFSITHAYASAVVQAGGVPVLVPALLAEDGWRELYPRLDGILFSGGGDIAGDRYAGGDHPLLSGVEPLRDELELGLLRAAAADGKPFLGICRGCQLVNVGFGGTLFAHLPDQLPGALAHDRPPDVRTLLAHTVELEPDTRLGGVLGERSLSVNSHHHQGLKSTGSGLRVVARAPDGLVEAIEKLDHPFGMAVQWHPEWLTDQAPTRRLFKSFVDAASKTRKNA